MSNRKSKTTTQPRRARRRTPPGTAPGTIAVDPAAHAPEIELIRYDRGGSADSFERRSITSLDELPPRGMEPSVTWLDVVGLGNAETLEAIGRRFGLHPLALEDVVNVTQRPKVEAYDTHLFVISRMPVNAAPAAAPAGGARSRSAEAATPWAEHEGQLETEQLAICLGEDFVVTFQERPGDVLERVRERARHGIGRMRSSGPDYLAYALLDAALDSFFPLLEAYGERVESLEQAVIERPMPEHTAAIHDLKRNLLMIRRTVWPQREMLSAVLRDESRFISHDTKLFLRDCYDHAIQILDMVETYREIASGLVEIQLSSVSNRMNEIMKVLTIIATIFIPLTFIVGVYGMNFDPEASPWNMPELRWRYGYPATLLIMACIGGGLLAWFRHKGWIGRAGARRGQGRKRGG